MKILDRFGNEIEVGDTVFNGHTGRDLVVTNIRPSDAGTGSILVMELPDKSILHYLVFCIDPVARDLVVDVTKKEKEGAMKYHLLNSQIDGGS